MTPRDEADHAVRSEQRLESRNEVKPYLRLGGMILTAMVAMYALTYVNSFELSHVMWSETRVFMTLLMGATMTVIMFGFMRSMYQNWKLNIAVVLGSVILFILATWLVRSQTTVQERSYMSAMVPHHSIAILTSERSEIADVRVCQLAVGIIESQRREILEMNWLIEDIERNGVAETAAEAHKRPVPSFTGMATRSCVSQG